MFNLEGYIVVLCGGSRGLGSHLAKAFLREKANVCIVDIVRPEETIEKQVFFCQCDLSKIQETKTAFANIFTKFKRVDVLVNSMRLAKAESVKLKDVEQWEKGIQIDLNTYFQSSLICCEMMKSLGSCSIINFSSVLADLVSLDQPLEYHCAKASINHLSRYLAVKYGANNIRVNTIAPGLISHLEAEKASSTPQTLYEKHAHLIPLLRTGSPQDIVFSTLFLASRFSSFITGHELVVDGGLSIREQLSAAAIMQNSPCLEKNYADSHV